MSADTSRKMRILIVINKLDRGGTEHHLLNVLPTLNKASLSISVFVLRQGGTLTEQMEKSGVHVHGCPFNLPHVLNLVLAGIFLLAHLWRKRPDAIHFFLPEAYLVGGFCSLLAPLPIRIMSRRSLNDYQQRRPYAAYFERFLHRKMDAFVANSNAVLEQLVDEIGDSEKLHLIYNGVSVSLANQHFSKVDMRHRLGLPANTLTIIMVANLIPYKGHSDLLEALAQAKPLPNDWRLLCVGRDDGIGGALMAQSKALKLERNIIWLGEQPDIADILKVADLAILPSHEEGLSNSILEAMAAGLCVIATDVGGNREALCPDYGVIVPAQATSTLATAIGKLANDLPLREKYGTAAQQHVATKFSVANCIAGYDQLYKKLRVMHSSLEL